MDPALLRERQLFKRHAFATPVVEAKKKKDDRHNSYDDVPKKRSKAAPPSIDIVTYKSMTGSSQYKFSVLAKIVKHMKNRHQEGDVHPLTLEEILDETNQLDAGNRTRQWLATEALKSNPKIEETPEGKYVFKPPYKLRDKKSLLKLLKQHDLKGTGGILLDDVIESLPKAEKAIKNLKDDIIFVTRPVDKKRVMFYNDRTCQFAIEEEFVKLWRATTIDAIDDEKIQEYLEKQGIRSMHDPANKKAAVPIKRRKIKRKLNQRKPRDNEHMSDVLKTYDEG